MKNEKILDFRFSILLGAERESSFIKTLSVYKFNNEMSIAYNNIMARYWNFGDSFLAEVPAVSFIWTDMTLYSFKFPRAEILGK